MKWFIAFLLHSKRTRLQLNGYALRAGRIAALLPTAHAGVYAENSKVCPTGRFNPGRLRGYFVN